MKLWVDDVRRPPSEDYYWLHTTIEAKRMIEAFTGEIEELNLDHDAGDYEIFGGDYIKILEYIEAYYPENNIVFVFHTMNPVGRDNMKAICEKNGWRIG